MKITILFSILFILLGCRTVKVTTSLQSENFSKELAELKSLFQIPALSVIVKNRENVIYEKYTGFADVDKKITNDKTTEFPIASLTKIFTAVVIMKLSEQGKIDLDDPINKYITNKSISDSIKIKHILSHTSQGNVGKNFYYSSRFSWLTQVIEKASGNTFETEINEKIILPLKLTHTYLLKD